MRRPCTSAVACCVALVLSACSSREDDRRAAGAPAGGSAYHAMNPSGGPDARPAMDQAPPPQPPETVFSERGGRFADVVEKDGQVQVVHGGRAGKPYASVAEVALSPDGRRCAYGALAGGKWRVVVDGKEGAPFDAVRAPAFSPDGAHVAYQARAGGQWHLVVDSAMSGGTPGRYLDHQFDSSSSRLAFVEDVDGRGRGRLVVSDLSFGRRTAVESEVSQVLLDAGRSRLAAIADGGGQQRMVTLDLRAPERVERGPAYDAVSDPVFAPDGRSLAYLAERSGRRIVVLNGREAPVVLGHVAGPPVIIPGRKAVGVLLVSLSGSVLVQEYFVGEKPRDRSYEEAEDLVYGPDGRRRAYAARRGQSWYAVLDGKEGPPFDRVVSPVFSPDGRYLAYRARKDAMRFVVVVDTGTGTVRMHGAHEQVFPVRFAADGRSIGYGVKDGTRLAWMTEAP